MDACITGGICRLIWNIDDFIDKSTPIFDDNEDDDEDTITYDNEYA